MKNKLKEVFFNNLNLELPERVGLALREGSKVFEVSFGPHILPTVTADKLDDETAFNFHSGLYLKENGNYLFPESQIPEISETHKTLMKSYAEWGGQWGGHSNPNFGRVVNLGTDGIRELIEKNKCNHPEAEPFYRGCSYALDALDILGERFRELAVKMMNECEDSDNRHRYELAAKAFETVPKKPAYDMTSGCLVFWMLFSLDGIDSPGRFDQYMRRVYEAEQDRKDADDVLERIWDAFHDTRTWNLCLSGSDENWNDMSNTLTYEILRLAAEKKYQTPNITLRVHRNTPEKLWNAIYETLSSGIGMPALYNDEVLCVALEKIGIPPCDSHEYCMNGCNQVDIMGKSHMGLEDGHVSFGKCLEYALHNGKNMMTGNTDSVETGNASEFTSYEQLLGAFYRQLDFVTYQACLGANAYQQMRADFQPNPLRSCLIEGCLEKGKDYRNGGPLYNHGQILAEAIADTGDSLWAVKKLVFIEKKYTMEQLVKALEADFEGYDKLYKDFSNCEKFGNDCEQVDSIVAEITNHYFTFLKRNHTYRGGIYTGGCSPYMFAPSYAVCMGALPNGKRKGSGIIANCIGAVPGCDVNGPTALLNSAMKYCQTEACSGFILMVKFDKKLFKSEKGKQGFINLAKSYFKGGGQQFTVTVVNSEELLDAKIHPELHRDLIVRVGGYSDYFINLDPLLQDNIIARSFLEV